MNIITFDIEDWFIYEQWKKGDVSYYKPIIDGYLDYFLDLLDQLDLKATFFCLGIIARSNPEVIKKIAERGHEIGSHSDQHQWITQISQSKFKEDTRIAIDSLEQVVGNKVISYRAPAFTITEKTKWALEVLIEQGIKYDSSIFPSSRSLGGFPSFTSTTPAIVEIGGESIKEFPISCKTIANKNIMFTGGGYFRLLPYNIIKRWMNDQDYNMTYFHIRDFDKEQKRIYSLRYFKSYYGINKALPKLERYLNDFEFISMGQAVDIIDWTKVEKIKL